jgi:hypothetical protein
MSGSRATMFPVVALQCKRLLQRDFATSEAATGANRERSPEHAKRTSADNRLSCAHAGE